MAFLRAASLIASHARTAVLLSKLLAHPIRDRSGVPDAVAPLYYDIHVKLDELLRVAGRNRNELTLHSNATRGHCLPPCPRNKLRDQRLEE